MQKSDINSIQLKTIISYLLIATTVLTTIPLYTIKLITKEQLNAHIILTGNTIVKIFMQNQYRINPLFQLMGYIEIPHIYTVFNIAFLLLSPIFTINIFRKRIMPELLPLIFYSYLTGDPLTPIFALSIINFERESIIKLCKGLYISLNPEYAIYSAVHNEIQFKNRLIRLLLGILGIVVMISLGIFNIAIITILKQPILTILYVLTIISYLMKTDNYLDYPITILISLINPQILYPIESMKTAKKITRKTHLLVYIIFGITIFGTIFYTINSKPITSIENNPGIEAYLKKNIPSGSRVVTINLDNSIKGLVSSLYLPIYIDKLDYEWNWSNYHEVRKNWEYLMDYTRMNQIKYIIIEKETTNAPYWPPSNEYNTYKYYLDPGIGKELIILENKLFNPQLQVYYVSNVEKINGDELINHFQNYWANTTNIKVYTGKNLIEITSTSPYQIYLWFKNPIQSDRVKDTGLIIELSTNQRQRIKNLQIYLSNSTNLGPAELTISNLNGTGLYLIGKPYTSKTAVSRYIVLKFEYNSTLKIEKLILTQFRLFDLITEEVSGNNILLTNKLSSLKIELEPIISTNSLLPRLTLTPGEKKVISIDNNFSKSILLTGYFIVNLLILYILENNEKDSENDSKSYLDINISKLFISLGIIIPLIYYLIHKPSILLIGWIGGGGFIYYSLMIIPLVIILPILTEPNYIDSITLMIFKANIIALSLNLITKKYIINNLLSNYLYTYWHIASIHSASDYIIFSLVYLSIGFLYGKGLMKNLLTIPTLYLLVYGSISLLDVLRIVNPIYLGTILSLNLVITDILLTRMGFSTKAAYNPYGLDLVIFKQGKKIYDIIIGWPCSGITGFFIYLTFITIFNIMYSEMHKLPRYSKRVIGLFIMGAIGTFILNGFRIATIIILAIKYSLNASEIFHSLIYDFIYWIYIIIMVYTLRKIK